MVLAVAMVGCSSEEIVDIRYLASDRYTAYLYSYDSESKSVAVADTLVRGAQLSVVLNRPQKVGEQLYLPVKMDKQTLYAAECSLVADFRDIVQEKSIFVRTPASIITDLQTSLVGGLAQKGEELEVIGYDSVDMSGRVYKYMVRPGAVEGYIYAKYTVFDKESALKRYKAEVYDKVHKAVKDSFGGGAAIGCDFYPTERVTFENNKMPEACYSLYLNISPAVIGNIEAYIAFAKQTKINTFVIDIKDNECPGYRAEAMQLYSPTNYARAGAKKEDMYRNAVRRLHEEGFYVVGRITCFKDSYLVKDHPEVAITEKATGKPFKHNKAYWPSPYVAVQCRVGKGGGA